MSRFCNAFQLKLIVKFPTHGNRTHDPIFTNMKEFYETSVKRPAFGLSDHATVEIQPQFRLHKPKTKRSVRRDTSASRKIELGCYPCEIDWSLVESTQNCAEKLQLFYGLC